jgi:hypothetical protein
VTVGGVATAPPEQADSNMAAINIRYRTLFFTFFSFFGLTEFGMPDNSEGRPRRQGKAERADLAGTTHVLTGLVHAQDHVVLRRADGTGVTIGRFRHGSIVCAGIAG